MRHRRPDRLDAVRQFQSTHPRGMRLESARSELASSNFNPRIGEGCDPHLPKMPQRQASNFNPRIREGCDKICIQNELHPEISIHTSARDATWYRGLPKIITDISIHASARDATNFTMRVWIGSTDFNPRIREGCDLSNSKVGDFSNISIHASARDATRYARVHRLLRHFHFNPRIREGCDVIQRRTFRKTFGISIHASARDATPEGLAGGIVSYNFNPRIREGCDVARQQYAPAHDISIHASARDATTTANRTRLQAIPHFNPRIREGCDSRQGNAKLIEDIFQSTHPRGMRLWFFLSQCTTSYFNPRIREGCDHSKAMATIVPMEFQSTHPRGMRLSILLE